MLDKNLNEIFEEVELEDVENIYGAGNFFRSCAWLGANCGMHIAAQFVGKMVNTAGPWGTSYDPAGVCDLARRYCK